MTKTLRASCLALVLALAGSDAGTSQELESLYRAGLEAFSSGRTYEALELLEAVADADAAYRDVQLLLGQACLVAGLPAPARQHFERTLETDPRNGHASYLLGLALYQEARYFEAAEAFERAHGLAPANPHPRIHRALALIRLGRPGEARSEIDAALALAPGEPAALAALAELELAAGRFDSAEAMARDLIAKLSPPQRLEATLLLGRIVFEAGRPAEAAAIFGRALDAAPGRSDLLYLLSQALLRGGDAAAGRAVLERFKERKALEQEIRLLEAALKSDPGSVEPRIRLVRLLLDHRQPGRARLHLAALERLAPAEPRLRALAADLERLRRGSP